MNGRLTRYLLGIILVLSAVGLHADPASISDKQLSDLDKIGKRLTIVVYRDKVQNIRNEISLIRSSLTKASPDERPKVLRKLADNTKWGTPERSTAYYVCAWYGVNYERSRDYLLNTVFWGYHGRPGYDTGGQKRPFCWAEDSFIYLYELYEHNLDFKLLHDLVTGNSDGAGASALYGIRTDALWKHPRGILHIAEISSKGFDFAQIGLSTNISWDARAEDLKKARAIYPAYIRRVSMDTKDPLQPTAVKLLNAASDAVYMKNNPTGPNTRYSRKLWSPNGQYIVFAEHTKSGDILKCTFAKSGKTIDLPAPKGKSIRISAWSPDSKSLLAFSYIGKNHEDYGTMISSPNLFTTSPGKGTYKVIWSDSEQKSLYPEARWIQGGKSILMELNGQGAYDIGHYLYTMRSDGSGLRRLWKGDFVYTMLSPDESRILLWILPKPWFDSPEPRQMAAVNLKTGAYKVYDKQIVALEPYAVERKKPGEEMRWSKNCDSVSLMVHSIDKDWDKYWRTTFKMP